MLYLGNLQNGKMTRILLDCVERSKQGKMSTAVMKDYDHYTRFRDMFIRQGGDRKFLNLVTWSEVKHRAYIDGDKIFLHGESQEGVFVDEQAWEDDQINRRNRDQK